MNGLIHCFEFSDFPTLFVFPGWLWEAQADCGCLCCLLSVLECLHRAPVLRFGELQSGVSGILSVCVPLAF